VKVTLESGETRNIFPGNPTMGMRIVKVEITNQDAQTPRFDEWFLACILTRFVYFEAPAYHPV
jgi:hypothetical protein